MLEVNQIDVCYDDLQVLWDVSLKVERSEIVTILGSNGVGKTTLCKTIVGILHPKSGTINFQGKKIDGLPTASIIKEGISLVPEGRRLFGNMTVRENLELGEWVSRTRKNLADKLEWVYTLFPILRDRQNQLAGSLSGGEQQMLAIARALMAEPKLLILDEPSLGLAPKIVLQLYELIKKIREEGLTILLIEQYADQALRISDRGYVMENGRISFEGPSELLSSDERIKKAYLGEE
ncbi:MAG: ABC transporter ATP-binding protein [Candidatus Caldarchaeum sp.]|nr:ABC transporter ATP-binding protein [Candidatus Caldarchaeum sp.]MDW7977903.1 ABC transporter ATP-binding protein [Candidatus Caldarchaeum sp.]MDW8359551.1 ABC transporter ATP-binding protein [Candidatus Caldarchaeum sp.]